LFEGKSKFNFRRELVKEDFYFWCIGFLRPSEKSSTWKTEMSEYTFQFLVQLLFLFTFYTKNLESAITEVGYLAITVQVQEIVLRALSVCQN